MLIRSQDKTIITTDLNLWISKEVVGYEIENNDFKLGAYFTEEKAIKVLDMICEHALELHFSTIVPSECGKIYGNVFQMPQDSEV